MHLIPVAQGAGLHQIGGIVHGHATGALHQRLHDQRGNLRVFARQQLLQCLRRAPCHICPGFARLRLASVGAGHDKGRLRQRPISIFEQRHIGYGQCAHRFAMVAARHANVAALGRQAHVLPIVKRHFQRDFGGRSPIRRIKRMPQCPAGLRAQALGQRHHRLVRETGKHDMLQLLQLLAQCRIDPRVGMPEQIGPPGTDAIEKTVACIVVQPDALPTHNRHQRQGVGARFQMVLHLGTGVPYGSQAARKQGRGSRRMGHGRHTNRPAPHGARTPTGPAYAAGITQFRQMRSILAAVQQLACRTRCALVHVSTLVCDLFAPCIAHQPSGKYLQSIPISAYASTSPPGACPTPCFLAC